MKKEFIILTLIITVLLIMAQPATAVETRITTNIYDQVSPVIDGNNISWIDWRASISNNGLIYSYALGSGPQTFEVDTYSGDPSQLTSGKNAISGNKVVYENYAKANNPWIDSDIYMHNIQTNVTSVITTDTSRQSDPDISGDRVVWMDFRTGNWDVFMKDTSTGVVQNITNHSSKQLFPRISGNKIVWTDDRTGNFEIFMYNISTGMTTQITTNNARQESPDIDGDKIVWVDYRYNVLLPSIFKYDLNNPVVNGALLTPINIKALTPRVNGDQVIWSQHNGLNWDVYAFDFFTNRTISVATGSSNQFSPDIYNNTAVWEDDRNGGYDIYAFENLYFPPPDTTAPTSFIGAPGGAFTNNTNISLSWGAVDPLPSDGLKNYDLDYSYNGGLWNNWLINTTSVTAPFSTSSGQGSYRFRVRAEDNAGNLGNFDGSTTVVFDTTKPVDPSTFTSPDSTGTWLGHNQIILNWSANATDALSGVGGYSVDWDNSPTPSGPPAMNVAYGVNSATSPPLADGNNWYAHIRTVDNAGNWTSTKNLGPFKIDFSAPTAPSSVTDDGAYTTNNTQINASWPASSDLQSGIASYEYSIGTSAGATNIVNWTANGNNTSVSHSIALSNGVTYYINVRAKNGVGLYSVPTSSNGITVDTTVPTAPSSVTDDGTYSNNNTQINASWPASSDPQSGIASYEYSIGTSAGATNIVNWTPNGNNTSVSHSIALSNGVKYYINVRAKNGAGLYSVPTSSNGITVDTIKPIDPTTFTSPDSTGTWLGHNQIILNWSADATDALSGVGGYSVNWDNSPTPSGAPAMNVAYGVNSATSPTLADGNNWYAHIRTVDNAGNWTSTKNLGPFKVDISAPNPMLSPVDDGNYTGNNKQLRASWSPAIDNQSGIASYEYSIGTSAGATNIVNWTDNGLNLSVTSTGLNLSAGSIYYINVRAKNGVGLYTAPASSNGIIVNTTISFVRTDLWTGMWGDVEATRILSGDFNDDGIDDIAAFYTIAIQSRVQIRVFLGNSSGGLSAPTIWWDSGAGNWDGVGSKIEVGDFTGDGKDDIAVLYGYISTRNVITFILESKTTGVGFKSPAPWWEAGAGNWDWAGSKLISGDFDDDGDDDLSILYGYQAQRDVAFFVFLSDKSKQKFTGGSRLWWRAGAGNWDWAGSKLTVGDYTGDGRDDVCILYGYQAQSDVAAFVFPASVNKFKASELWWRAGAGNWDWIGSKLISGNYNNDTKSDLSIFYGYNAIVQSTLYGLPSKGTKFTPPGIWWNSGPGGWNWNSTQVTSGDYNGDGLDEVAGFYNLGSGYGRVSVFR